MPRWSCGPILALGKGSASFGAFLLPEYQSMSESPRRHLRVVNDAKEPIQEPRVWLLLGERQGDNAQVLALGRALAQDLGWTCEVKQIRYDPNCEVPFRQRGASLIG